MSVYTTTARAQYLLAALVHRAYSNTALVHVHLTLVSGPPGVCGNVMGLAPATTRATVAAKDLRSACTVHHMSTAHNRFCRSQASSSAIALSVRHLTNYSLQN